MAVHSSSAGREGCRRRFKLSSKCCLTVLTGQIVPGMQTTKPLSFAVVPSCNNVRSHHMGAHGDCADTVAPQQPAGQSSCLLWLVEKNLPRSQREILGVVETQWQLSNSATEARCCLLPVTGCTRITKGSNARESCQRGPLLTHLCLITCNRWAAAQAQLCRGSGVPPARKKYP